MLTANAFDCEVPEGTPHWLLQHKWREWWLFLGRTITPDEDEPEQVFLARRQESWRVWIVCVCRNS